MSNEIGEVSTNEYDSEGGRYKKAYSIDHRQQEVLKGIHLEIQKGDFTVIMGSSGAGKSTLLYALSGMDYISSGKIIFNGEEIENFSPDKMAVFRREHCGFVFPAK